MNVRRLLTVAVFLAALHPAGTVGADDVRPVQVQLREQEPDVFLLQWQIPKLIPIHAAPTPFLPAGCQPEGERSVQDEETGWILRQIIRCEGGLMGQTIGIDYPFMNAAVSTVLRVSFLSGEEHARILAPGEDRWQLPQGPPDVLRYVQQAVLLGVEHVFDHFVHIALVVVFCLLGNRALTGLFAAGQLGAIGLSLFGLRLAPELSELGLAVAIVILAREALRDPVQRRQVSTLAAAAGLVHGLGLASIVGGVGGVGSAGALVLAVLGMDATLVVLGAMFFFVVSKTSWQRRIAYATGGVAVALAFGLFFREPAVRAQQRRGSAFPGQAGPSGGMASPGSQRIAPSAPDAPIQSFLAVEAFETRHEVLVRLRDIWTDAADVVAIEDQSAVKDSVAEMILASANVTIDGEVRVPLLDRVDFVTVDPRGVLLRPEPVPEPVEEAFIGVTTVYLTPKTPATVTLTWDAYADVSAVPTTVIDPESTQTVILTPDEPSIAWTNALSEDPIPTVSAVAVEPRTLPLPLVSLPLLGLAAFAFVRKRHRLVRVILATAVALAPLGSVALALPLSSAPSTDEARRILASLLPNVYRAFEFREESAAYDRLAVSVTGDTLTEVYLEHRRALEMEERGGARARVEAVGVQAVESVQPADEGFESVALWTVGGTVTHFGHRHFRENRYRASVVVVPVDDYWKIRAIEVLDEERVR